MSNYPTGVTGNEPQITGIWPCCSCGGAGGERDEDGFAPCSHCRGAGVEPEEFEAGYVRDLAAEGATDDRAANVLAWVRGCGFDRHVAADREMLRAAAALRRVQR